MAEPIRQRIDAALAGGALRYHDLAALVFPEDLYPRAWRYASQGGPPGCYMALSAAIRRYGFQRWYDKRSGVEMVARAASKGEPSDG